jgi:hypothetical protein
MAELCPNVEVNLLQAGELLGKHSRGIAQLYR